LSRELVNQINAESRQPRIESLEKYRGSAEKAHREREKAFYESLEGRGINTSAGNCEPFVMFDPYFTTQFP
jgi:hypothetical protein